MADLLLYLLGIQLLLIIILSAGVVVLVGRLRRLRRSRQQLQRIP